MVKRYDSNLLAEFAATLLTKAGLDRDRSDTVAEILVEGDLLGHTTHGLQLLGPYLKSIQAGKMTLTGEPECLNDGGSTLLWDGHYLPGPWLTVKAIETALERVDRFGIVTVNIRRSHHLACLQAYLKRVTDHGRIILLTCSDPSVASVAPHGGLKALYTPNPLAAGIPTEREPILIDISMSSTTNGLTMRSREEGKRLPHPWVQDSQGNPTDDPDALFTDPPGTIYPLGGPDSGHKGFALGILVEALTSALGGFGRADHPTNWGASVFLQIIDPQRFGGADRFTGETQAFADACRSNPTRPDGPSVRLPGEAGLKRRAEQLAKGVELYPGIIDSLAKWGAKYDTEPPAALPD